MRGFFSAEKSGHDEFEESTEEVCVHSFFLALLALACQPTRQSQIKPLTEEEKKAKLAELRQKMAEKRAQNNVKATEEAKSNEALRRKAGKVKSRTG
jgi:ribosomal protein L29